METILALCVLAGVLYFVMNLEEKEQNSPTSKTNKTGNYKKEIALGLEYLAQNYEQTKNLIDANAFFSSNQDNNAWSYAFELEIAYFQLIIFKHCIMLYDRSRIIWLEYLAETMPNKEIWIESTKNEMQYEYRRADIAKEKGQNIAQGIENRWIELILKIYGLNHNESNISVVKKFLKERNDFYIDILEQQRGKRKEPIMAIFISNFWNFVSNITNFVVSVVLNKITYLFLCKCIKISWNSLLGKRWLQDLCMPNTTKPHILLNKGCVS